MTTLPLSAVQPLHSVEKCFLQLLLSRFTLTRRSATPNTGLELSIEFDNDTPAIWSREGKRYLRTILSSDKRGHFQRIFDKFIIEGRGAGPLNFEDPEFFFRYASGGTLPVIEFDGKNGPSHYYCLFYRDIYPIGWNIANGGTETRSELLNPAETVIRELQEELIIADLKKGERYFFSVGGEEAVDCPPHAALRLWKQRIPGLNPDALKAVRADMEWEPGPDSLIVTMDGGEAVKRDGLYININGDDFGIEFDRVAKIRLPAQVALLDGEIDHGRLVGSPVGLFDAGHFSARLRLGETAHVPDFFFFGGERFEGSAKFTQLLLNEFVEHLRPIRTEMERNELLQAINANQHLHLCPVTENITKRHAFQK